MYSKQINKRKAMTTEQFNKYKFGIKTKVKVQGYWYKVLGVDFDGGFIDLKPGDVHYQGVEEIKESYEVSKEKNILSVSSL